MCVLHPDDGGHESIQSHLITLLSEIVNSCSIVSNWSFNFV
jgi:hypothetical protein